MHRFLAMTVFLPVCMLAGCSTSGGGTDGKDSETDGLPRSTRTPDGFPIAAKVSFDNVNRLSIEGTVKFIEGTIEPEPKVGTKVYDLGPLALGDRVESLCIATGDGSLDPMTALFDADGYRVFWNDDINSDTNNFDSAFEGPIRHDSDGYFLAVTSTSFFDTIGSFKCTLTLEPGVAIAPLIGQSVVLQFSGGEDVHVAGIDYGTVPAFDGANVASGFSSDTAALMDLIVSLTREDYARYDVTISTTDDAEPEGNFTTLFFGTRSARSIFGIADDIDFYNSDDMDNAIVFLEAFGDLSSSVDAVGQALANVVSHEIGHTLGLMHNNDVTTLMDTTGADETLLADQSFGIADIIDFPIGKQNAPLLLEETLGRAVAKTRTLPDDGLWRCGTCGATLSLVSGTNTATSD
ncbi:MAG: zinc-dependent metalloprotease [Planctomycetes bacterium]|nr:zinc-dependent metalloprotease [Planctomycetota bacterium]